jgi:hypothetical protein
MKAGRFARRAIYAASIAPLNFYDKMLEKLFSFFREVIANSPFAHYTVVPRCWKKFSNVLSFRFVLLKGDKNGIHSGVYYDSCDPESRIHTRMACERD